MVVSHGYSNVPAAMTWLTENLASKGYVVAAIRHDDPPITDKAKFAQPLVRRPLDVAYVTETLKGILARENLIDPSRVALVGYSMGGYGVLTAAGATLDPNSPIMAMVPGCVSESVRARRVEERCARRQRACVRLLQLPPRVAEPSPRGEPRDSGINTPLLLIAGSLDHRVDYSNRRRG